jgi:hypothetical protein
VSGSADYSTSTIGQLRDSLDPNSAHDAITGAEKWTRRGRAGVSQTSPAYGGDSHVKTKTTG